MLSATHLGLAWSIGMGALVFSAAAMALSMYAPRRKMPASLGLLGVAVFLYTRSMVSHASADGDFSAAMLADWLHLVLICLWTGEVFVAGFLVPVWPAGARMEDRNDCARYVASLSASAAIAVAGIAATGLYSAWHNLGSASALAGNPYGAVLLIKVALVAVAVMLGGINRFFVMPSLMAGLRSGKPETAPSARRFAMILRTEAGVLLGVLTLAAILSATPPQVPG
jgi:putative copper resistance protein D